MAKSVLLEMEVVLRAVYELPRKSVLKAMLQVLGLPNVQVELPEQVALALNYYERGLDFADALHLTAGSDVRALYTFDVKFARRARSLGAPVECVARG